MKKIQLSQEELRNLALRAQEYYVQNNTFPKKIMEELWNVIYPFASKYSLYKSRKTNLQNMSDLLQISYEALCSSVRKYDPKKMDNFFNYTAKWITAYVDAEQTRNLSLFRFGSRKDRRLFFKISRVKDLSQEEQAQILGVTPYELSAFSAATKIPKNILKKRASDDSDMEAEEYLCADIPDPAQLFDIKDLYTKIHTIFSDFEEELKASGSERDIEILNLLRRVGATEKGNFKKEENEDGLPQTYEDIAKRYGVSREAIRQASQKLKDRLRYRLQKNGIDEKAHHAFI